MENFLIKGSQALKAINIDLVYPGMDITIDFLHIERSKPSEFHSLHAHPNFEFHYIAEGQGEVGFIDRNSIDSSNIVEIPAIIKSINTPEICEYHLKNPGDQKIIENTKILKVKAGDAFMIPPGQFCWQKSSRENPIVEYGMRFSFHIKKTETPINKYLLKEYKIIHQLLSQNNIQVNHENKKIKSIFETIFAEAYHRLPGFILKIKNEFLNLIILFARKSWDNTKTEYFLPEVNTTEKRLEQIDNFIETNIGNPIKISQLAEHLFMSERSLSRFVKEHKGVSVHQYILQIRIKKSVVLCVNTDYTLTDVAYKTGFSSPFHLSKTIKQYTGINPSQL